MPAFVCDALWRVINVWQSVVMGSVSDVDIFANASGGYALNLVGAVSPTDLLRSLDAGALELDDLDARAVFEIYAQGREARWWLARRVGPGAMLDRLVHDRLVAVRREAAKNPRLSPENIGILLADGIGRADVELLASLARRDPWVVYPAIVSYLVHEPRSAVAKRVVRHAAKFRLGRWAWENKKKRPLVMACEVPEWRREVLLSGLAQWQRKNLSRLYALGFTDAEILEALHRVADMSSYTEALFALLSQREEEVFDVLCTSQRGLVRFDNFERSLVDIIYTRVLRSESKWRFGSVEADYVTLAPLLVDEWSCLAWELSTATRASWLSDDVVLALLDAMWSTGPGNDAVLHGNEVPLAASRLLGYAIDDAKRAGDRSSILRVLVYCKEWGVWSPRLVEQVVSHFSDVESRGLELRSYKKDWTFCTPIGWQRVGGAVARVESVRCDTLVSGYVFGYVTGAYGDVESDVLRSLLTRLARCDVSARVGVVGYVRGVESWGGVLVRCAQLLSVGEVLSVISDGIDALCEASRRDIYGVDAFLDGGFRRVLSTLYALFDESGDEATQGEVLDALRRVYIALLFRDSGLGSRTDADSAASYLRALTLDDLGGRLVASFLRGGMLGLGFAPSAEALAHAPWLTGQGLGLLERDLVSLVGDSLRFLLRLCTGPHGLEARGLLHQVLCAVRADCHFVPEKLYGAVVDAVGDELVITDALFTRLWKNDMSLLLADDYLRRLVSRYLGATLFSEREWDFARLLLSDGFSGSAEEFIAVCQLDA